MPPEQTPQELARRLLVLTFALGHATDGGENAEITALFCERERVILQLERVEPSPELMETLRQVQQAEDLVLHSFHLGKAEAVRDLQRGLQGRKVAGTYASKGTLQAFDRTG